MCNSCKTACNCQDTPRTPVAGEVWVYKPDPLSTAIVKLVEGEDIYYKTSAGVRATSSISSFRLYYSPPKPKSREFFVNKSNTSLLKADGSVSFAFGEEFAKKNGLHNFIRFVEATE